MIDQHPMPLDLAQAATRARLALNWYAGTDWLVTELDDPVRREARIVGCEPAIADLTALTAGPDKLLLIAHGSEPGLLASFADAVPTGRVAQWSGPSYLDVTRSGVDKDSALGALCRRLGVQPAAVAAIGDGMHRPVLRGDDCRSRELTPRHRCNPCRVTSGSLANCS